MGNCLVTKLKGAVNNDSLKIFNAIEIKIQGSGDSSRRTISRIGGTAEKPVLASLPDGTLYNYQSDTPLTQPSPRTQVKPLDFVCSGNSTLLIEDKYNIVGFGINKYQGHAGTLTGLVPAAFYLNFNDFDYCDSLELLNVGNMDMHGDIIDLKRCISITTLQVGYGDFTGDLVALVKAWITNGRSTTGEVDFGHFYYNTTFSGIIKFNGKNVPMDANTGSAALSWESSTKISLKIISSSKVLCVGYSDADITTKTASGGDWEGCTVTKCD